MHLESQMGDSDLVIYQVEAARFLFCCMFSFWIFHMQYAELKPVPCITYADAFALREKCATPILKQVIFIYTIKHNYLIWCGELFIFSYIVVVSKIDLHCQWFRFVEVELQDELEIYTEKRYSA